MRKGIHADHLKICQALRHGHMLQFALTFAINARSLIMIKLQLIEKRRLPFDSYCLSLVGFS